MSKRIPKAQKEKSTSLIAPPIVKPDSENIVFSFDTLERTQYFNLDGTCANWSSDLFEMMKNISSITKQELLSGKYRTYRVHNHENANPPNDFPQGVSKNDCYQIRIGKSKGGIHGIFVDNIFFVIWLDPLHNMYPDENHGGLRKITPPSTCCKERESEIDRLKTELAQALEDCSFWEQEYSKLENKQKGTMQ